jgi:hypothetical protein
MINRSEKQKEVGVAYLSKKKQQKQQKIKKN